MKPQANDRVWWVPVNARGTVTKPWFPDRVHQCPTACVVAPTTREALDPMALGTCRYCKQEMPA